MHETLKKWQKKEKKNKDELSFKNTYPLFMKLIIWGFTTAICSITHFHKKILQETAQMSSSQHSTTKIDI